jgi:hypothetical protein
MIENKRLPLAALLECQGGTPADARRDYGPAQGRDARIQRTSVARRTRRGSFFSPAIHCRCGQHCGQAGLVGPQAANLLRAAFVAQSLSSKKALRIKDLLEHDTAVTCMLVGSDHAIAVVEFLCRTSIEVARG